VIITAFGNEALHEEAKRLGASAVLDKPFELDDLRALARRLSDSRARTGGGALRLSFQPIGAK
jgi:hypothetical protein